MWVLLLEARNHLQIISQSPAFHPHFDLVLYWLWGDAIFSQPCYPLDKQILRHPVCVCMYVFPLECRYLKPPPFPGPSFTFTWIVLVDYGGAVINGEFGKYCSSLLEVFSGYWAIVSIVKVGVVLSKAKFQYNELKSQHAFAVLSMPSSSHMPFLTSKFVVSQQPSIGNLGKWRGGGNFFHQFSH